MATNSVQNARYGTTTTDYLILRKSLRGKLVVDGSLDISSNAVFNSNVFIKDTLEVDHDIFSDTLSTNEIYVNNVTAEGNILVKGDRITAYNSVDIFGNVTVYDHIVFGNTNAYMYSRANQNIGINTDTPTSTLDIYGNNSRSLNVYSSNPTNFNIIARNNENKGIAVFANTTISSIGFYNNARIGESDISGNVPTPDAKIQYTSSGVLSFDVSKNTNIYSRMSITPGATNPVDHLLDETLVTYGASSTKSYLWDSLEIPSMKTSSTSTFVSYDNSTNTFINVVTPNKKGIAIGGGNYVNDSTRSFGTVGLLHSNGEYYPAMNIVSGNSNIKQKFTVGINTHSPSVDKYTVDINGPIKLTNGETTITYRATSEIISMGFSRIHPNIGVAVGTPYVLPSGFFSNNNNHKILYTTDGGNSWDTVIIDDVVLTNTIKNFRDVYVYDNYLNIWVGDESELYTNYTNPRLISFYSLIEDIPTPPNFNLISYSSVCINNSQRVFISDIGRSIYYFDVSNNENYENFYVNVSDISTNIAVRVKALDTGSSITNILQVRGFQDKLYVIGSQKYLQIWGNVNTATPTLDNTTQRNDNGTYRSLYVYDDNTAVVVGRNVISYTNNGGTTWFDASVNIQNYTLNSVQMYSRSMSIAVGNNGLILASMDGNQTWSVMSSSILSSSGNSGLLIDPSCNLTNIAITDPNTFLISKTVHAYKYDNPDLSGKNTSGNSSVFYCNYPYFFNNPQNYVFDVFGSSRYSGDININDGGNLQSTNETFYALNTNVKHIFFGNQANTVSIGNPTNSIVTHNYDFNVLHDSLFNGNVSVEKDATITGNVLMRSKLRVIGDVSFNSTLEVDDTTYLNDRLFVQKDVSMNENLFVRKNTVFIGEEYVAGNVQFAQHLKVTGDVSFNSDLQVDKTTYLNERLFVQDDVSMNASLFVAKNEVIGGEMSVGGNVQFAQTLQVRGDVSFNSNLHVDKTTYLNDRLFVQKDVSMNERLYVRNDVSTNANLLVAQNSVLGGELLVGDTVQFAQTLQVSGDVSFNSKLQVDNTAYLNDRLFVQKDVSMNARLYVRNDVSTNENLFVAKNAFTGGQLTVGKDTNLGQKLNVVGDAVFNSNVQVDKTAYLNDSLYVLKDAYMNADLIVEKNAYLYGEVQITGNIKFANIINVDGDVSFNSKLQVEKATFLNDRLYVQKDVSLNTNLFVSRDATINGKTVFNGNVQFSQPLSVDGDVLFNSNLQVNQTAFLNDRLVVQNDALMNANLFVSKNTILNEETTVNGNIQIAKRINVFGDAVFQSNLRVEKPAYLNDRLVVLKDVSMNANLFVSRDVMINGKTVFNGNVQFAQPLSVVGDALFNSNLQVQKTAYLNDRLVVQNDVLMNANLFVSRDAVFNGNVQFAQPLSVGGDALFNSNLQVNKTAYLNDRLVVLKDVSMNANLFVSRDAVFNGNVQFAQQLRVVGDVSFDSNLQVDKITYLNDRLFVSKDASLNANLFVAKTTILNGETTVNGNVQFAQQLRVVGDVSFNSNLQVDKITYLNDRLFVSKDASLNANLFVAKTAILNGETTVNGNVQFVQQMRVVGDVSFNSSLHVNKATYLNDQLYVLKDVSMNANLFVSKNASFNANVKVMNSMQASTYEGTDPAKIFIGSKWLTAPVGYTAPLRNIYIGTDDTAGTTQQTQNIIKIGGGNDTVAIGGSRGLTAQTIKVGKTMTINNDAGSSNGAGFVIADGSNPNAGSVLISADRNGYSFKAPGQTSVVTMDISAIVLPMNNSNLQIANGILTLSRQQGSTANYRIGVGEIDINTVLVKKYAATDSLFNTQNVDTNLGVNGNVYARQGLSVGKSTISPNTPNTTLDINGYVAHNNGYIWQF